MDDHSVDLVVIGAGASGASVAYEAVRRGLSVALLEGGILAVAPAAAAQNCCMAACGISNLLLKPLT